MAEKEIKYPTGARIKEIFEPAMDVLTHIVQKNFSDDVAKRILEDLNLRLNGDDRQNELSGKDTSGFYNAPDNKVPYHAARVLTAVELLDKQVEKGVIQFKEGAQPALNSTVSLITEQMNHHFEINPKKQAIATLIELKRSASLRLPEFAEAVANLEAAHDEYVIKGNVHNQWVRDNKGKEASEKTEEPIRKYNDVPAVIEAASAVSPVANSFRKELPVNSTYIQELVENIKNGISIEAIRDIKKDLKSKGDLKELSEYLDNNKEHDPKQLAELFSKASDEVKDAGEDVNKVFSAARNVLDGGKVIRR